MSSNPNRQRLLSPLDYLAIMAGAQPPEQEPSWAMGEDPRMMGMEQPYQPPPYPTPPMPFADTPPPMPVNPYAPGY